MQAGLGRFLNRQGNAQGNWNDWALIFIALVMCFLAIPTIYFASKYPERTIAWLGGNPETEAYFNGKLREIVTAPYNPPMPNSMKEYITRQQDEKLKDKLYHHIYNGDGFFMLMGESGSGKTTMMQHLLKENYTEGVIFVAVNADKLVDVPKNKVRDVVEEAVLDQFGECKNHPRRHPAFTNFIAQANEVRKSAEGKKKEHPLIIYVTLDTKDLKISYEAMGNIAVAVGGMASDLSSKSNSCKTILEFSKTGISDTLREIRTDFARFEVGAMAETEFQAIGKQLLTVKDPQNLVEPYLQYYHNWLGGHTKALMGLVEDAARSEIESATADTKNETLRRLKAEIDEEYYRVCENLDKEPELKLLKEMAEAGAKGIGPRALPNTILAKLSERNSDSTLIRKVGKNNARIHRYSHALYLHNVTGPKDEKATDNIEKVKEKFGMKAKSA